MVRAINSLQGFKTSAKREGSERLTGEEIWAMLAFPLSVARTKPQ